jgi:SAM-dependent methyltransferase
VSGDARFPSGFFRRADEAPDPEFYGAARLVVHVDPPTLAALTDAYRELLPAGARVLDLMSSWVSHLPPETEYREVVGLGLNAEELARNPRLTRAVVHDLNREPRLPFPDACFDAALCALSVQYLVRPVEVFAEVARVLRPGGVCAVGVSHRLFPTKAIAGWQLLAPAQRPQLVAHYLALTGDYEAARVLDRSPARADPLWLVVGLTRPRSDPTVPR